MRTFAVIILCLGVIMTIMPKQSTKKELQDSEEMVKKTRKNGILLIVLGTLTLLCYFFISVI